MKSSMQVGILDCGNIRNMNVLFLCRGNVGRSTFAKYIFDKLAPEHSSVSAGTSPSGENDTLDEISADYVIEAMSEEGLDVSHHKRKKVTKEMIENADLMVSMAEPETVQDFVSQHSNFIEWEIDDPKGTDLKSHIRIKDEVKEKVKDLIKTL